jgi:hypothetical protein
LYHIPFVVYSVKGTFPRSQPEPCFQLVLNCLQLRAAGSSATCERQEAAPYNSEWALLQRSSLNTSNTVGECYSICYCLLSRQLAGWSGGLLMKSLQAVPCIIYGSACCSYGMLDAWQTQSP